MLTRFRPANAGTPVLLGQDIIVEMDDDRPRMFEANADGGMGSRTPCSDSVRPYLDNAGVRLRNRRSTCQNFSKMAAALSPAGPSQCAHLPLRIVENFLDMSHFPYVHTGVLGEEPVTEVTDYRSESPPARR
jgi:hypothetical protein